MPSPREGILDSKDWDEIKPDFDHNWVLNEQWKPRCQPAASCSRVERGLARLKKLSGLETLPSSEKLRPTAYLDGLRGFAAFLVYWHHHQLWAHAMVPGQNFDPIFENGFGYQGKYHFVALPGVRNFFTGGHFAVGIFFVISGYVLSLKPLTLIHASEQAKLSDNVGSALFRRWIRLFLPIIIAMSLYATSWHVTGLWMDGIIPKPTWVDEMWTFYDDIKNFSFIFKEDGNPFFRYNTHLWTIPKEFKGSIVVYTTLMAISRCSRNARLSVQLALIYYFMYITDGAYCAMFVAGMLLCDLDLLAKRDDLPRILKRLGSAQSFIYAHLFVFGMYLGGVPSENRNMEQLQAARGWYYLSLLKPNAVFDHKWFFLFWASVFLVASIPRIKWLKTFFETRFCQFLGRISYAFYLVHGPVLAILGDRLYFAVGWEAQARHDNIPGWFNLLPLPRAGPLGLEISFLVPHIIIMPVTLCVAELVTRCIDTPSVKFASWIYRKSLADSTTKQAKA